MKNCCANFHEQSCATYYVLNNQEFSSLTVDSHMANAGKRWISPETRLKLFTWWFSIAQAGLFCWKSIFGLNPAFFASIIYLCLYKALFYLTPFRSNYFWMI